MVSLTTVSAALTLQRSEIAGNASERLRSLLEIRFQNSLTGVKKSTTSVKKSTPQSRNQQPQSRNQQPQSRNQQPQSRNQQPQSRNQQLQSQYLYSTGDLKSDSK